MPQILIGFCLPHRALITPSIPPYLVSTPLPASLTPGTISVVVFILDLILFSSIGITFLARWVYFPKTTAKLFETDIEQTTYLSTTAIAAATLVELVSLVCGAKWAHWDVACFALWWVTLAFSIFSATTVYWLLIRDENVKIENLSPTLMYPVTGLLASATAGSVLVGYTKLSVGLSQPVIIVSYLLLGAGESVCLPPHLCCQTSAGPR